ncbi:FeoB-associated Cys-rich membrane protein [uncultured Clostridium sp.]|nr:FeoB-associated Cys-rich membrane protein [uncultured Clostridium sp.]
MEILITALLVIAAGYILFKNIKKSSKGGCNCSGCSSKCPKYKK